jgi:PIN domain nuclease of toxin-antitoxin system
MRVLLDSGVWFRRYHRLGLSKPLTRFLAAEVTEWHLTTVSIAGLLYKWRHRNLPVADPARWLDESLEGFTLQPLTAQIARRAGLWDWEHGDPADRIIAATAAELDLTLIHTNERLKDLAGFPQRYFRGGMM